jgi:hypothetical protein
VIDVSKPDDVGDEARIQYAEWSPTRPTIVSIKINATVFI